MLVVVGTYGSRLEAEVAKGKLEAFNVKALVQADDSGGMRPPMAFAIGVRLLVDEGDLPEAKEILN